jgi:hypothetical protein
MATTKKRHVPTLDQLHAMTPKRRRAAMDRMSSDELEAVTVPCNGEVHGTEGDGCMVCLNTGWGRMLKPLSEGEASSTKNDVLGFVADVFNTTSRLTDVDKNEVLSELFNNVRSAYSAMVAGIQARENLMAANDTRSCDDIRYQINRSLADVEQARQRSKFALSAEEEKRELRCAFTDLARIEADVRILRSKLTSLYYKIDYEWSKKP